MILKYSWTIKWIETEWYQQIKEDGLFRSFWTVYFYTKSDLVHPSNVKWPLLLIHRSFWFQTVHCRTRLSSLMHVTVSFGSWSFTLRTVHLWLDRPSGSIRSVIWIFGLEFYLVRISKMMHHRWLDHGSWIFKKSWPKSVPQTEPNNLGPWIFTILNF